MERAGNNQGISIIIPVYNEERYINSTVADLLSRQTEVPVEILIIDGSKRKNTIGTIRNRQVVKISSSRGRALQMNIGASRAGKNILLFLHCDTILPEHAFEDIVNVFNSTSSVAGAFDLSLDNSRLLFRLIGKWASWKHRLTRIPYGDQAIFIRKDYFEKIGGYKEIPLMEDLDLMKRIKRKKDTITILRSSVKTSSRKWEEEGPLETIFKNWMLQALYLFGVSPEQLVRYYYRKNINE